MSISPLICVIDDDPGVRDTIAALIRALGYRAVVFATAEEYLASGLLLETSCVITDMLLGDMNGAQLQDRLIADGYRIPIIFVTAVRDAQIVRKVLNRGALGVFSKPLNQTDLIVCLDRALKEGGH